MDRRQFLAANAALLGTALMPPMLFAATVNPVDDPGSYNHKFVDVNGIRMHYVDEGKGPLVILLHGFPLLWYSWRHQIAPLVAAGYRVVVPDQRGYGQTSCPEEVSAYDISLLVGDIVGLVDALGEDSAVVVGWDIGSFVAWHCALMRPDLFRALVMVCTAYSPRPPMTYSALWKKAFPGKVIYQQYFQEPGKADREFDRDTAKTVRSSLYSLSASAKPEEAWNTLFNPGSTFWDNLADPYERKIADPRQLPPFLNQTALDYYVQQFSATGFTPPLNWYRNLDRNWEITSFLAGARVLQPALYITGAHDTGLKWGKSSLDALNINAPKLEGKVMIPDAAHMVPEEKPAEFNAALLAFLRGL